MKQPPKQRLIQAYVGRPSPQVQIQIMPLQWGLAFIVSRHCMGGTLGPISLMVYWWGGSWDATYENDFRKVRGND